MVMAYNFTRVLNILGAQRLREYCVGRRVCMARKWPETEKKAC